MNKLNIIVSGIVKNNPTFVLVLGMCPTLAFLVSSYIFLTIILYYTSPLL